jgi:hypothetical protein
MTQEETIFFNSDAAKVTSARVVIGNQTFAMAGITSVEVAKEVPKANWAMPSLVLVIGLTAMPTSVPTGIIFTLIGGLWLYFEISKDTKYHLVIRAAGGEVNALSSTNATDIEVIASAITDAMVHRG